MESEAGHHFLAAKKEFLLGMKTLIDMDIRFIEALFQCPPEEEKPEKAQKVEIG